jgi:hypothetical protein
MHTIAKLGLAAALLVGGATVTIAEDAAAGAKAGVKAGTAVDATTTGSVGTQNYGSLISSLQAGTTADLTAFNESSTVSCVGVSSLQGGGDAAALDNALTQNEANVTSLRSSIEGNAELMTKLETTCAASIPDFTVQDIISVETGADGAFTFYVDDRA